MAVAWTASVALAAAGGFWAAGQATSPPQVSTQSPQPVSVEVVQGTVTVTQSYGVTAAWPATPSGANGVAGTLTSLALPASGATVRPGDVVYTVDLAPVVAMEGPVPAFRGLGAGAVGADVRQLQQFLAREGLLRGEADGRFGAATASAVNLWLKGLGLPETGLVPVGRVLFLKSLPAQLAPAKDLRVGARVSPGQELLVEATAAPDFSFTVLPEAVGQTSEGLTVTIDADGRQWRAVVDRLASATDDTGRMVAVLRPVDGEESICGNECADVIQLGGDALLPGKVVLVPETTGSQVPAAAVETDAAGATRVQMADGTTRDVTVRASSEGRSIVDGVAPGERVLVATAAGR